MAVSAGPEPGRSTVRLTSVVAVEAAADEAGPRLARWADDLPRLEGGTVTGVGIESTQLARTSVHFSLTVTYDGLTPADVGARLRELAATSDAVEIVPREPSGDDFDNWLLLSVVGFDTVSVSPHLIVDGEVPVGTRVAYTARTEIDPI